MTSELQALLAEDLSNLSAEAVMKRAKKFARNPDRHALGKPVKVALLSSYTTDFLSDTLILQLARRGVAAQLWRGPYGVIAAAVLDDQGSLESFGPDLVVLLPSHRDISARAHLGGDGYAAAVAEAKVWQAMWSHLTVPVVQLTFDPPPTRALGDLDGFCVGGMLDHVRRVNRVLAETVPPHVSLVDAEWLSARIGFEYWHDSRLYQMCKQPFSFECVPMLTDALASSAAGLLGRGRKCLVLDLDNTLWGGIIGDCGVNGIAVGAETTEGEAFTAFQRYCKELSRRGVVLAVCSKNDDATARSPFLRHTGMVLSLDDIACFVANFDDKASNIRRIASTLNLGLDSMVFVDDSPVERAWVRSQLPDVHVVELPEEPASYIRAVDDVFAFPVVRLTAEDQGRGSSYRARAVMEDALATGVDMESFLVSLQAEAIVEAVSPSSVDRVVQLVAKTNQFKLNAILFSAAEVSARAQDILTIRFRDRLQDYGIVVVVVTRPEGDTLRIDNWVMSCRVFSRRLEYATRSILNGMAVKRGLSRLALAYHPSGKNGLLVEVLPKLGFVATDGEDWVAPATMPANLPQTHIAITEAMPCQ